MNNNFLIIIFALIIIGIVYYFTYIKQNACPTCSACLFTTTDAKGYLKQLALTCATRLVGVIREDMISADDVLASFIENKTTLIIASNYSPEGLVQQIEAGDITIKQIKIVALNTFINNGVRVYAVMTFKDGMANILNTPFENFDTAFQLFDTHIRKNISEKDNNYIILLNENAACPQSAPVIPPQPPKKESCCGARF